MSQSVLNLHLHPKQGEAFLTRATEVLYGGAAGGGKSHLMRVASVIWCAEIPGLQVYLFRRLSPDLVKNHMEGPKGYRSMLARWESDGLVKIVEDEIRFWNGSKIYLCHCKDEKDRFKYQGAEIHVLLIDELTHFTETIYRYLRGRVRMVGIKLAEKYKGAFPRIVAGSNPGGVGHQWVKKTFIDHAPPMKLREMVPNEGGMVRQYIPARLDDNPSMAQDDPSYEDKLSGLGSKALVQALRDGDWDIVEGAFFDNWDQKRHVVKPFTIPADWATFMSGDWGSAKPFSFGWWAIVQDDYKTVEGLTLPRGCLVRYREWYGAAKDESGITRPDTGLKMNAADVGKGLAERKANGICYLDPAAFAEDGGPSIAERMNSECSAVFTPADNKRVARRGALGGWDQVRERLDGDEDGKPMMVLFETCVDSIRTLPALQHDELRPEDVDTDSEDHAADEIRYACMSRPYTRPSKKPAAKSRADYGTRTVQDDHSVRVM